MIVFFKLVFVAMVASAAVAVTYSSWCLWPSFWAFPLAGVAAALWLLFLLICTKALR